MNAMEVTAIQLPPHFSDFTGICKYRDEVCAHFGLGLRRMNGNGSCFFHACVFLLSKHGGIQVTPEELRHRVVSFFRECKQGMHGQLGERVMMDMECELQEPLVSSSKKHDGEVPGNVTSYLDASMNTGVWVAGYHWVRAVAHLYQVCFNVVIHGFPCVYAFGNTSHAQLFLYKRDVETHYDALPRRLNHVPDAPSESEVVDAPSEPEVVYTTRARRAGPPPINQTAALSKLPSDNQVVYTTDMPHTPPPHTATSGPGIVGRF